MDKTTQSPIDVSSQKIRESHLKHLVDLFLLNHRFNKRDNITISYAYNQDSMTSGCLYFVMNQHDFKYNKDINLQIRALSKEDQENIYRLYYLNIEKIPFYLKWFFRIEYVIKYILSEKSVFDYSLIKESRSYFYKKLMNEYRKEIFKLGFKIK